MNNITTLTLDTQDPYSQDFEEQIDLMGVSIEKVIVYPHHYDVQYSGTKEALKEMIDTFWNDKILYGLID